MSSLFRSDKFSWLKGAKCLVTGGAGFIGSHIADALLQVGAEVRVIDDFSSGTEANLKGFNVKVFRGSIADEKLVQQAVDGVDYIFHLGAIPAVPRSIDKPLETAWVNIWGTQVLLECARQAKVKRLVFSASSSSYGGTPGEAPRHEEMIPKPLSPYAAQKLSAEYLARVYALTMGLDTISLRYFNIFGPRQNPKSEYAAVIPKFITLALKGEQIPVFGDGEQRRDFTYVDNAVLANLLATRPDIRGGGEVINIGCGSNFSLNHLLNEISKLCGKPLSTKYNPTRLGDVRFSQADISKANRLIGYEPVVSFEEGLRRLFEELR